MGTIALIGSNGQLGSDLVRASLARGLDVVALTRSDFDLTDQAQVERVLSAIRPEVVINTAAFHKVEACETQPETAFAVNATAVRNLAQLTRRLGARLVHLSTDYVFGGAQGEPYDETITPDPVNLYGVSKLAGELLAQSTSSHQLIVRTSGLYGIAGSSGKGGNFVQTMLRLGREQGRVSVVNDQRLSPTYTADLADMLLRLVEMEAEGVWHATNSESCSWYEFAREIFELSGVQAEVTPVTTDVIGSPVRRPRYSVLANRRLERSGVGLMRPWRLALAAYLSAAEQLLRGAQREVVNC